MKTVILNTNDNLKIQCYLYDEVKEPKGVIQIVHGAAEHAQRYEKFIHLLNIHGFIVISNDHRGHGKTADLNNSKLGFFSEDNGWQKLVDDLNVINRYIKEQFNMPIIMMGHSMGSFLVRSYMIKYKSNLDAAILSGTAWNGKFILKILRTLAFKRQKKFGSDFTDEKIWALSFKPLNKIFKKEGNSGVEWQTRDKKVQQAFLDDPKTGFIFTSSGYKDLADGLLYNQNKKNIKSMNTNIPILIISGTKDPVGAFTKGPKKFYKVLKKAGFKHLFIKMYINYRHEIIFENNKEVVENDILRFLDKLI